MAPVERFRFEFVDQVPDDPAQGVLYVSMHHATVIHLCACGCGVEVVTPLDPTDYKLTFDGETITLRPSVGNWRLPCRSHYFVTNSSVRWAGDMTDDQIADGRARDRRAKELAHGQHHPETLEPVTDSDQGFRRGVRAFLRWLLRR